MRTLDLNILKEGTVGISPTAGSFYAQAALYCLTLLGHKSGVIINVQGEFSENFVIKWTDELDDRVIHTWKDKEEATEYGAMGISVLLIMILTDYTITGRTSKVGKRTSC